MVSINTLEAVGSWGEGSVHRITSGQFSSNAYFCDCPIGGGGFLIDPGLDGETIDAELSRHGFYPGAVFCTHGHFDHVGSASYFQQKYGCDVFVPRLDEKVMKSSNFLLMAMKMKHRITLPEATLIDAGFSMEIGDMSLKYLSAPGHTNGSCIIEFGSAWFTGDTLYKRGIGLSKLPGEDEKLLKKTIRQYWDGLTPERFIYPGHGGCTDGESLRLRNTALLKFLAMDDL